MDSKIKEELIDEIQHLNIKKEEDFVIMPFNIASAVLELRNASEVDVDDRAIAVSSSTASIESFVHPQIRHYTSKIVHNRPILILHNVRQTRLHNGQRVELGVFDLVLTFANQDDYFNYRQEISQHHGYSIRPPQAH